MNPAIKVAAGVGGGYLLGRHHKLRYAVGLGAALLGKRLDLNPTTLVLTGVKSLRELPEVMDLGDTVRGELATSGRRAAMTLMSSRLDAVSDRLRSRSDALDQRGDGEVDDVYPDEPARELDRRDDLDPEGRHDDESDPHVEEPYDARDTYDDEDGVPEDGVDATDTDRDDAPTDRDEPREPRRRARRQERIRS